jgi:beta-lactamase regulating signal transducer with metallopeptidase domain
MLPVAASYLPVVNLPVPGPLQAYAGVRNAAVAVVGSSENQRAIPSVVTVGDLEAVPDTQDAHGLSAVVMPRGAPVVSGRGPQLLAETASSRSGVHQAAPLRSEVVATGGWSQLLAGLWFAGIVVLLLRVGLGLAATRRLGRRAACPRDGEWQRLVAELSRRIGLTRPVRVLCSARAVVPMTWGWFRPVVLVPEAGAAWSAARKRVVLLHELNHVKRHDCASQLIAHVACAVYWFNPLVWLAARALRIERERACDEAVVRDGTQASAYADHLLQIARAHRDTGWSSLAAVAMARRSQLEGRLLSILDADQRRRPSRTPPRAPAARRRCRARVAEHPS